MRRSIVAPLFNDTVDSDNEGITPVNQSDGSFNKLPDGPERFHRMLPGMPLSQHPTNLDGFNPFANATAHDPMLGSEADQLPVFSRMTPSHHITAPFTLGPRAGDGLTSRAARRIDLSVPDYHDHRSSTVAIAPHASRDHQFSGPESVETGEPLLELDELTEIDSTFARQPTERQLGINCSVDRGYQLGHFHSSALQPAPRSAFANPGFVKRPEQLQNRSRHIPQVPSTGRYWQELAYDHDQATQHPEQRAMPNVQRFLPSHASFQNQALDTLGGIRDIERAYPIYGASLQERSAERGRRADAHEQFVSHRAEEMDVRDRSLQNQRVSRLRHASFAHDLSEDQPAVDDDASPSSLRVLSSIPPAYAQWRPFDYARYGNRVLVEPETENHAARPSGFARVEWRSRPSRLPDSADDDNHALQGNRNNVGPRSWPQEDNYRGGRASSYFSGATQREQSFYDDDGEFRNGNMSNQPFLPPRYEDGESYYRDDGGVSYATRMEGGYSLNDYDDREYQNDQEPAKRRKTTSGYTHQPTITHRASAPELAPQVGSGRTSPYRRTRGSDGECNEKGFGGQRKWWSRTRKGRLEVRRKNRDPWMKAVYHYQIRETLFENAGKQGNNYVHPRASGPEPGDQTSYLLIQKYWGLEERQHWTRILDNILMRFEPRNYKAPELLSKAQGDMMFRGRVVVDTDNRPIIDWPLLPATLSSQFEGGYMEALLRLCPQMATRDFWARMPKYIKSPGTYGQKSQLAPTFSAINMRCARFRKQNGLIAWSTRHGSDVLRARVVGKMSQEDKDNNTTENVYM